MNKPALYSRASDIQRHIAKEVVRAYADTLRSDGMQSLLDVGSGSGDVLMEILVPGLAHGFTRITGIDISPKMVEYSAKRYANLEGVDFKELDIETDQLPMEYHGQFDRVTSFCCLHWILNQKKSVENVFQALRRNGDCLLVYIGSTTIYDAYKVLSKNPRWKRLKVVAEMLTPLLDHRQIGEEYESLLAQVGFIDRKVQVMKRSFVYEGLVNFKDNMKSIDPFGLSDSEYDEYFVGICDYFDSMGLRERIPGTEDYRFILNYRVVVAYARKGE